MDGKESLEALFLYANEGIIITNNKGIIVKANPAAEEMFGYDKGELINQAIEILVPQRFSHQHEKHREKFNRSPHPRRMGIGIILHGKKKNNVEFPVEISLSPYTIDSENYVIAFVIDTTLRLMQEKTIRQTLEALEKQAAKLEVLNISLENKVKERTLVLEEALNELEHSRDELRKALEKEHELNEMKSRFVSMASHEFRTPLATILSSLSLITSYSSPDQEEKRNKHIERIRSAVYNLNGILHEFLSLSRLEEGKETNNPININIVEFMEELVQEMTALKRPGQHIKYKHTNNGKKFVEVDNKLLKNIMINLVSNAIKFSPEEGHIYISTNVDNKAFTLSVKDEGIGIPGDEQEKLFERFFRARNAANIQGTGLGLHIVTRYTELMGGTIGFTSEINKGATFTLQLKQ